MSRLSTRLLIVVVTVFLGGCSLFGEKSDPTRDWSAQRLYNAAKERLDEADFEPAIDYYEKLESRYPFGTLAQQGQLEIAYAYYRHGEPESALAAIDRFVKLYPQNVRLDYAYYLRGLVNFHRGRSIIDRFVPPDPSQRDPEAAVQAFRDFEKITTGYQNSPYAEDAAQRMLYLRDILAAHEIHVAGYYLRRGAYVAAVNRARVVVENYQRTPSVPDALTIMVKAYRRMELPDLADDALRVLRLNYPEHAEIAEVEASSAS